MDQIKINKSVLRNILTLSEKRLEEYLLKTREWDYEHEFLFKDNGSTILAVAHMDTVEHTSYFKEFDLGHDTILMTPSLDDRLGVFTILEILPQMRIKPDILITTDEECCMSTAQYFADSDDFANKPYNWIVEFDRAGSDVVVYDFEIPEMLSDLQDSGFKIGTGTYSDIRELETLGCGAFNVGIGYHLQHTERCFASVREWLNQLGKFKKFFRKHQYTKYPFTPKPSRSYQLWDDDEWKDVPKYWEDQILDQMGLSGMDDTKPYGVGVYKNDGIHKITNRVKSYSKKGKKWVGL